MSSTRRPEEDSTDRRPARGDVQQLSEPASSQERWPHWSGGDSYCSGSRHRTIHREVHHATFGLLQRSGEQGAVLLGRMLIQHREGIEGRDTSVLQ